MEVLKNGDLVMAAVADGFVCLLTRDQLFRESASCVLKAFPQFAVVVVNVPQQPWNQYRERFIGLWIQEPIAAVPGRLIHWPQVPQPPLGIKP